MNNKILVLDAEIKHSDHKKLTDTYRYTLDPWEIACEDVSELKYDQQSNTYICSKYNGILKYACLVDLERIMEYEKNVTATKEYYQTRLEKNIFPVIIKDKFETYVERGLFDKHAISLGTKYIFVVDRCYDCKTNTEKVEDKEDISKKDKNKNYVELQMNRADDKDNMRNIYNLVSINCRNYYQTVLINGRAISFKQTISFLCAADARIQLIEKNDLVQIIVFNVYGDISEEKIARGIEIKSCDVLKLMADDVNTVLLTDDFDILKKYECIDEVEDIIDDLDTYAYDSDEVLLEQHNKDNKIIAVNKIDKLIVIDGKIDYKLHPDTTTVVFKPMTKIYYLCCDLLNKIEELKNEIQKHRTRINKQIPDKSGTLQFPEHTFCLVLSGYYDTDKPEFCPVDKYIYDKVIQLGRKVVFIQSMKIYEEMHYKPQLYKYVDGDGIMEFDTKNTGIITCYGRIAASTRDDMTDSDDIKFVSSGLLIF